MDILEQLVKKGIITPRQEQMELSRNVFDTLKQKQIGIFESPTGTGKTLAFMAAAVKFCLENPGHKVVISTSSKQLQSQMLQELKKIKKVKNLKNFTCIIVKGKSNYLLRKKVEDRLNSCHDGKIHRIYETLLKEADRVGGDIELLSENVIEQVNSIAPQMLESLRTPLSLPVAKTDYAYAIRKKAEEANIIIVNHSLFLCYNLLLSKDTNPLFKRNKIILDSETLPEDRTVSVIIDEAHTVEGIAQRLFAKETALRDVLFLADHLLKTVAKSNSKLKQEYTKMEKYIDSISRIAQSKRVEYVHLTPDRITWDPVVQTVNRYIVSFKSFIKMILSLIPNNDDFINIKEKATQVNEVINTVYSVLKDTGQQTKSYCYLITFSPERKYPSFAVVTPRIGGAMYNVLFDFDSIVLVGGTLRDPDREEITDDTDRFRTIRSRLAIDSLLSRRKGSTILKAKVFTGFNLKRLATVYVYPEGPYPPGYNDEQNENKNYRELLARQYILPQRKRIVSIVKKSTKALILTAAHYETQMFKDLLQDMKDRTILVYPDNGSSLTQKVEEFKMLDKAVLITASAWEGLDVPVDTLIISRLPFASPSDPYYIAYYENEKNYFQNTLSEKVARIKASQKEHSKRVFDTFIKFRQGLGRAVRGENDYCNIHILDPRAYEPKYFQSFLKNTHRVVEVRR